MNVATILREKGRNIVSESPATPIRDIVKRLADEKIGALLVLGPGGELAGIVSERDVIREIARQGDGCLDEAVSTIMTSNVVTCTEHDSVAAVMGVMTAGRFRHMPVTENDRLVGIVSIGDVVKNHIAEVEMEASALKSYLVAG